MNKSAQLITQFAEMRLSQAGSGRNTDILDVAEKGNLHPNTVRNALRKGDTMLSTFSAMLEASGLELVVVDKCGVDTLDDIDCLVESKLL